MTVDRQLDSASYWVAAIASSTTDPPTSIKGLSLYSNAPR